VENLPVGLPDQNWKSTQLQ